MFYVDVNKDPVKAPQNLAASLLEVLWERNVFCHGENCLILRRFEVLLSEMSLSASLTAMMSAVHSSRVRMYSGAARLTAFLYLTSSCGNNSQSEDETCHMDQSGLLLLIFLISSTFSHLPKIQILGSSRHVRTILLCTSSESRKGK